MKPSDIGELTIEEMDSKEYELMEELLNLRFQKETGQLSNTARISAIRKDIARIKTVRNQKAKGIGTYGKKD
jgi:large subunit ribosomal protein L29